MAATIFPVPLSGIQETKLTTTGDTLYASAASTAARLGIGSTGQVLTVASGLPSWATPSSGTPAYVGAVAHTVTAQSLTTGVATALTFGSEEVDTDGYHSTVTNTSRMTVPSGKGGNYLINGVVWLDGSSSFVIFYVYKNGAAITNGVHEGQLAIQSVGDFRTSFSIVVTGAVATDYYEIFGAGNGTPVKQKARFAFTYLGA